ncbi:MAG TPA: hypothetical protein VKA15_01730 [Isosphaeraceae bacterium]|nr:hypothetical protein [Isosphaeraceae bacterium]
MSSDVANASQSIARESYSDELVALRDRIRQQPADVRADLEPLIEEVLEHAQFRGRVLEIAREALERFRLDLAALRFDLEVTRSERDSLRFLGPDAS